VQLTKMCGMWATVVCFEITCAANEVKSYLSGVLAYDVTPCRCGFGNTVVCARQEPEPREVGWRTFLLYRVEYDR
jgi:hypothetical protein